MIPQGAAAALGLWLMAAPGVLDHGERASTVSWIVGPLIVSVSFIAAFAIGRPLRWLNVPLGAALLVAPWFAGSGAAALVNSLVAGAAVLALTAVTPGGADRVYAGGWASLFR